MTNFEGPRFSPQPRAGRGYIYLKKFSKLDFSYQCPFASYQHQYPTLAGSTRCSQAVYHPNTSLTQCFLTSMFQWELVSSTWHENYVTNHLALFWLLKLTRLWMKQKVFELTKIYFVYHLTKFTKCC